jgi:hypothetical protein
VLNESLRDEYLVQSDVTAPFITYFDVSYVRVSVMGYIYIIVCKSFRYPFKFGYPVCHRAGLYASEGKYVCFYWWGSKDETLGAELHVLIQILTFVWHYVHNFFMLASMHCTDLHFFTHCRSRCTVRSGMHLRVKVKIKLILAQTMKTQSGR